MGQAVSGWLGQALPRAQGWGKQASTSVLGWLAGAEHRQGVLAGARVSQVWQHGEAVVVMLRGAEKGEWTVETTSWSPLFHIPLAYQPILQLPQLLASPLSCVPLSHRILLPLTPG